MQQSVVHLGSQEQRVLKAYHVKECNIVSSMGF